MYNAWKTRPIITVKVDNKWQEKETRLSAVYLYTAFEVQQFLYLQSSDRQQPYNTELLQPLQKKWVKNVNGR